MIDRRTEAEITWAARAVALPLQFEACGRLLIEVVDPEDGTRREVRCNLDRGHTTEPCSGHWTLASEHVETVAVGDALR